MTQSGPTTKNIMMILMVVAAVAISLGLMSLGSEIKADKFYDRGKEFYKAEQYDKAIQNYKKAIEASPKEPKYYYKIGNALRKSNQAEQATVLYKKSLEIDPEYFKSHEKLIKTYVALGRNQQAEDAGKRALALFKNDHKERNEIIQLLDSIDK